MFQFIKSRFPSFFSYSKNLGWNIAYLRLRLEAPYIRWKIARKVKRLRNKEIINVCFMLWSPAQFKADSLFQLMLKHPRFNPIICPYPNKSYKEPAEMQKLLESARKHFKTKGYPVLEEVGIRNIRRQFHPDIIFEATPYESARSALLGTVEKELRCYIPYCFRNTDSWISYNQVKQNRMWFNFVENSFYLALARRTMTNKGSNVICSGFPYVDKYLFPEQFPTTDEPGWKVSSVPRKRVIWAPHWAIQHGSLLQAGSFPLVAELMLKLAKEYANRIQFVFKPHPNLRLMLLSHSDWGSEKTDRYYAEWSNMENTQFENGDYTNLFLHSDAMIHDCGSFVIEYMLTGHPCCFLHKAESMPQFNQITNDALQAHYKAETEAEIRDFFDRVILNGDDSKAEERRTFSEKYLQPEGNQSAAQNIIDTILGSKSEA